MEGGGGGGGGGMDKWNGMNGWKDGMEWNGRNGMEWNGPPPEWNGNMNNGME